MLGEQIPNTLPYTEYMEYFSPEFTLQISPFTAFDNLNTREYLSSISSRILQNLKYAHGTPQISMSNPPPVALEPIDPEEDNPELRMTRMQRDKHTVRDDEFFDTDDGDRAVKDPTAPRRVLITPEELGAGSALTAPATAVAKPADAQADASASASSKASAPEEKPSAAAAAAAAATTTTTTTTKATSAESAETETDKKAATAKNADPDNIVADEEETTVNRPATKRTRKGESDAASALTSTDTAEEPVTKTEDVVEEEETLQSGSVGPADPEPTISQPILRLAINTEGIKTEPPPPSKEPPKTE